MQMIEKSRIAKSGQFSLLKNKTIKFTRVVLKNFKSQMSKGSGCVSPPHLHVNFHIAVSAVAVSYLKTRVWEEGESSIQLARISCFQHCLKNSLNSVLLLCASLPYLLFYNFATKVNFTYASLTPCEEAMILLSH